jgi:D-glycero-D-manno-heptose 1,7-bisphosphate phosphatase
MEILRKVVFLDRDGVINRDSTGYIKDWSEFKFIPGSIEAIRDLTRNGFDSMLITNQSALGRRLISRRNFEHIHAMMCEAIAAGGGKITDIFFCPHLPEDGCDCRKPKPGLILQARRKYNIDLTRALMIGDSTKDIECARNAGCGYAVLVKTGKDVGVEKELKAKRIVADYVAQNLAAAVRWIIQFHCKDEIHGSLLFEPDKTG